MRKLTSTFTFLGVATALVLCGCSASVSVGESAPEDLPQSVSSGEVEVQAQDALTQQVGQQAPPVTCTEDLPAEVGATITCSMSDGQVTYDVLITVTSVADDKVNFDVQVADVPSSQ